MPKLTVIQKDVSLVEDFSPSTQPKFTFFRDKGEELVDSIYNAYVNEHGLYKYVRAETHGPQHQFIPGHYWKGMGRGGDLFDKALTPPNHVSVGRRKHLTWLLFATLTDRRQVSGGESGVYASHCNIYASHPEVYTEKLIKNKNLVEAEEGLVEILLQFNVGVPRQSAEYWIVVACTLFREFGGNPVKLFKHCGSTIEGIQTWKKEETRKRGYDPLPGFGEKITSLYLMYIAELGALPYPQDAFPVDVHVQRIFLQVGAIVLHNRTSNAELARVIRDFLCELTQKKNYSKLVLSNAFWLLGSELCNGCHKHRALGITCPVMISDIDCSGTRSTDGYFARGCWDPQDHVFTRGDRRPLFGLPTQVIKFERKRGGKIVPPSTSLLFE